MSSKSVVLRKGRFSASGQTYSITKCCDSNDHPIIADPMDPDRSRQNTGIITESLKWMHREGRARCYGYVIMPDHLHMMIQLGDKASLSEVMRSFSTFTSREINKLNGWSGAFWQQGYYDHAIRNNEAFDRHLNYMAENPVRKVYVDSPEDWQFTRILPEW